jgi:transposase
VRFRLDEQANRPQVLSFGVEKGLWRKVGASDARMTGISMKETVMSPGISLATLGLSIERIEANPDKLLILARSTSTTAACPVCGGQSAHIHSRYQRSLADLPSQGRAVVLRLCTRRFRCTRMECPQKIFTERLAATAGHSYLRRTARLEGIVHHLGLALGGRPGQSLAKRLLIPVSRHTLLRVVRRRVTRQAAIDKPRIIGVDDWAWRRGHRYGTIICDLQQHRIIDLLPDREAATLKTWLAERPTITIIARDRGAGYIQAATEGRPEATQVADRWHLMENASAAFLTAVQQSMQVLRSVLGTGGVDPKRLTCAERRQHDGWLHREQENAAILALAKQGITIKGIVRRTGRSRKLVRQVLRGGRTDIFRSRASSLEPFTEQLETAWVNGCQNGAALWRQMKAAGFTGGLRVVTEWATRQRKQADRGDTGQPSGPAPSACRIARMMTSEREHATSACIIATIERALPELLTARDLMDRFHNLIQRRKSADLETWIAEAASSLLASFVSGIVSDQAAVQAALKEPWSNGQTEGQNTKLKLIKRQMYGRAKLDLLRARLLSAP